MKKQKSDIDKRVEISFFKRFAIPLLELCNTQDNLPINLLEAINDLREADPIEDATKTKVQLLKLMLQTIIFRYESAFEYYHLRFLKPSVVPKFSFSQFDTELAEKLQELTDGTVQASSWYGVIKALEEAEKRDGKKRIKGLSELAKELKDEE